MEVEVPWDQGESVKPGSSCLLSPLPSPPLPWALRASAFLGSYCGIKVSVSGADCMEWGEDLPMALLCPGSRDASQA